MCFNSTDKMSDTTQNNIVWGCPKHQGPLLGATLHRRNGPGQSCKLVDNAHTSQTHLFDARVPHNIRSAQCSAYNRTHLRKNASNPPRIMGWLHRTGEQSHPKRNWQHTCRNTRTTNERKQPKACNTGLRTPPLAQNMPPRCLYQSPSSGAPASSSSLRSVYLCNRGQNRRSNPA